MEEEGVEESERRKEGWRGGKESSWHGEDEKRAGGRRKERKE